MGNGIMMPSPSTLLKNPVKKPKQLMIARRSKKTLRISTKELSCKNPALWNMIVDGDLRKSVISALTCLDEDFNFNDDWMMSTSQLRPVFYSSEKTAVSKFADPLAPPPPPQHNDDEDYYDETEQDEINSQLEEIEDSKFTKEVIISYLETISSHHPKITMLLHQVDLLEEEREETTRQCSTPRTMRMQRESREALLHSIRQELRSVLTTRDEENN